MSVKKKPTIKQLRARAKFVKMVRARAKEARRAKRAQVAGAKKRIASRLKLGKRLYGKKQATARRRNTTTKKSTTSVIKNGRRLYGAAAKAVLKSRGSKKRNSSKRRGVMLSGRKRNRGFWSGHIKKAVSSRLHKPISFRRRNQRRNSSVPAGIEEMHKKFLGRPTSGSFEIVAPAGTPSDVAVLGELVALKTEEEEFVFDKGEAYMGADAKGNLYVLGDVQVESNTNFGEIEEIDYLARKDHLEANPFRWKRRRKARRNPGQLIEYYHEFGEEGGTLPKLKTDGDGMLHIVGGSYTIEPEGITD